QANGFRFAQLVLSWMSFPPAALSAPMDRARSVTVWVRIVPPRSPRMMTRRSPQRLQRPFRGSFDVFDLGTVTAQSGAQRLQILRLRVPQGENRGERGPLLLGKEASRRKTRASQRVDDFAAPILADVLTEFKLDRHAAKGSTSRIVINGA